MTMRAAIACAFAGVLCLFPMGVGRAQSIALEKMGQDLYVQVRLDATDEATVGAWSTSGGAKLAAVLPQVLHCQGGVAADATGSSSIRCSGALRSDGLALEAAVDLAPIARTLNGTRGIQLWVNNPLLGFGSTSVAMTEEVNGPRVSRTARFAAGVIPAPIEIRFGYRPGQLLGMYLPLFGLALALTLVAATMARAGFPGLALSAIVLGTMVWMGASSLLQADLPVRILLLGSPLANFAALSIDLWPPLFCVAVGVSAGGRMRGSRVRRGTFGDVVGSYAVIPLVLSSVVGGLPSIERQDWGSLAGWLAVAPAFLLSRRAWIRVRGRASVRLLTAGALKERVSALAAKAGCPQVKVYLSFSTRPQTANAFALPGKSIFLTAALVRLLSKREVDAVAAHEVSHVRRTNRGGWTALGFAMLLCETPVRELLYILPGGLLGAMAVPIAMYLAALHGLRKHEFAADAGAAALTGDARAMIGSLARIARNNDQPLDMPAGAEWFSSHPSTARRIRTLAAAAQIETAELEALCRDDDPGERYEIPAAAAAAGGHLFTPAWQRANAQRYSWAVIFGSCGSGLLVAWLLGKFAGFGVGAVLGGVVLGCGLTKAVAGFAMSSNYGRLRRGLSAKLGVGGQVVGLALDSEARVYNGFRFSDVGLLRFEGGRLCYQSERTMIALDPADVIEVGMVAAAPSNWFRGQPMMRFRNSESGQSFGFILHTLDWAPGQRRLLRSIERWRATEISAEGTLLRGFDPVAGQAFRGPTIAEAARAFQVAGGICLAMAIPMRFALRADWQYVAWALAVTACAYASMLLPSMLYRVSLLPAEAAAPVRTN